MKTLHLATLLVLFQTLMVFGQTTVSPTKAYYKNSEGALLTEKQVDSVVVAVSAKVKKMGMIALKDLKGKEVRGDSVIYDFSVHVIDSTTVDKFIKDRERKARIIGNALPEFSLKDVHGNTVKLEDFKGKPIVINLWFTACPPCIAEMPELNRIKALPEYEDVVFLAITFEGKDKVKKFLTKKPFDFIHLVNARAYCEYFTYAYPVNIFVDSNGIVTDLQGGMPTVSEKYSNGVAENARIDSRDFIKALNKISGR